MERAVVININIAIPIPEGTTRKQAQVIAENYELPHGYIENSYKFVTIREKKNG